MEEYKNNALEPNQDNQSFESDDIESMASMHEDNTILNNRKKAEYEEAKEYIGIIMRELEETKGKLASLTVDSKRKKFNAMQIHSTPSNKARFFLISDSINVLLSIWQLILWIKASVYSIKKSSKERTIFFMKT